MAATKKMQLEIEKALKKVQEGIEEFQVIWGRMEEAPEGSKKDKFEGELKKELKRLQRERDKIRQWLAMPETKAHIPELEAARRRVEIEMERFKQCEKASKIKAFSKEGLVQQAKIDPTEQAKSEAAAFLNKTMDALQLQVDKCEAEVEALTGGSTKTGKKTTSRIIELEGHIAKHSWHRTKLEQILRLLENEEVTAEEVDGIKDRVLYYIEAHQDDDYLEDEEMYEDFPFQRLMGKVGEDFTGPIAMAKTPTALRSPKVGSPQVSPAAPSLAEAAPSFKDAVPGAKQKGRTLGVLSAPASQHGSPEHQQAEQQSEQENAQVVPQLSGSPLKRLNRSLTDAAAAIEALAEDEEARAEGEAKAGVPGGAKPDASVPEGPLEGAVALPSAEPESKDGAGTPGTREEKGPAPTSSSALQEGTPGKGGKGGKEKAVGAEEVESASGADAKKLRSPGQAAKGPAKGEDIKPSASPGPSPSKGKRARAQQQKEAEAQKQQLEQQQRQQQQQQQQQPQQPKLLMSQVLKASKPAAGAAPPLSGTSSPGGLSTVSQPMPPGGSPGALKQKPAGAKEQPLPTLKPAAGAAPTRAGSPWDLGAGKGMQAGGGSNGEAAGTGAVGGKRPGEQPSAWSRSVAEAAGLDPNLFVEVPGKKGARESPPPPAAADVSATSSGNGGKATAPASLGAAAAASASASAPASAPASTSASGHMTAADKENMGGGEQAHMGSCVSFARTLSSIRATAAAEGGDLPLRRPSSGGPESTGRISPGVLQQRRLTPPGNGLSIPGAAPGGPLPLTPKDSNKATVAAAQRQPGDREPCAEASSAATSPPPASSTAGESASLDEDDMLLWGLVDQQEAQGAAHGPGFSVGPSAALGLGPPPPPLKGRAQGEAGGAPGSRGVSPAPSSSRESPEAPAVGRSGAAPGAPARPGTPSAQFAPGQPQGAGRLGALAQGQGQLPPGLLGPQSSQSQEEYEGLLRLVRQHEAQQQQQTGGLQGALPSAGMSEQQWRQMLPQDLIPGLAQPLARPPAFAMQPPPLAHMMMQQAQLSAIRQQHHQHSQQQQQHILMQQQQQQQLQRQFPQGPQNQAPGQVFPGAPSFDAFAFQQQQQQQQHQHQQMGVHGLPPHLLGAGSGQFLSRTTTKSPPPATGHDALGGAPFTGPRPFVPARPVATLTSQLAPLAGDTSGARQAARPPGSVGPASLSSWMQRDQGSPGWAPRRASPAPPSPGDDITFPSNLLSQSPQRDMEKSTAQLLEGSPPVVKQQNAPGDPAAGSAAMLPSPGSLGSSWGPQRMFQLPSGVPASVPQHWLVHRHDQQQQQQQLQQLMLQRRVADQRKLHQQQHQQQQQLQQQMQQQNLTLSLQTLQQQQQALSTQETPSSPGMAFPPLVPDRPRQVSAAPGAPAASQAHQQRAMGAPQGDPLVLPDGTLLPGSESLETLWDPQAKNSALWGAYLNLEGAGGGALGRHAKPSSGYEPQRRCDVPLTWPRKPIAPEHAPALFEKLGTDALFFAFYFQQGTYHHYLAARELKRQSWRFHKKYSTWFQRHLSAPTISEQYERGTYVYFDFHLHNSTADQPRPAGSTASGSQPANQPVGWCHRVKNDFVFEYEHLEDDLDTRVVLHSDQWAS